MARVCDRAIPQRTNAGIATEFRRCVRAFRDWEESKPEEVAQFIDALDEEDVAEFAKSPATANLVRDLAFAYFRREQFPTHSAAEGLTAGIYKQLRRSDRTADGQPGSECSCRRLPKRQGMLATALATHEDTR